MCAIQSWCHMCPFFAPPPPSPFNCQLKLAPLGSALSPLRWRANLRWSYGEGVYKHKHRPCWPPPLLCTHVGRRSCGAAPFPHYHSGMDVYMCSCMCVNNMCVYVCIEVYCIPLLYGIPSLFSFPARQSAIRWCSRLTIPCQPSHQPLPAPLPSLIPLSCCFFPCTSNQQHCPPPSQGGVGGTDTGNGDPLVFSKWFSFPCPFTLCTPAHHHCSPPAVWPSGQSHTLPCGQLGFSLVHKASGNRVTSECNVCICMCTCVSMYLCM